MYKYKNIIIFGIVALGIIFGLFTIVSSNNTEEDKGKKEMVDTILENLKYSASPRLSIKYCKEALEIDPENGEVHFRLAEAYRDMANIVVETDKEKEYYLELSKEEFRIAEKFGYEVPDASNESKGTVTNK